MLIEMDSICMADEVHLCQIKICGENYGMQKLPEEFRTL